MNHFINDLKYIKNKIDEDIENQIDNQILKNAIQYALENGKRWRPIIYLALFNTSNIQINNYKSLTNIFLFLEYIHNASLILDDMPMMDNDDFRRNKLTLHKKYDEATSKLAALQLILLSQYHIANLFSELKKDNYFNDETEYNLIYNKTTNIIYKYLGNNGLCLGQFLDLNMNLNEKTLDNWLDMVYKKTSSLFILAFLLGYIFSRKSVENLDDIIKIGEYFGYIYQMLDDLEDFQIDKTKKFNNNILLIIDKSKVYQLIDSYFSKMTNLLNKYNLGCIEISNILKLLKSKWLKTKAITI